VAKAFHHGFYWLTAHADAEDLVKRCDACQKFSRRAHVPDQELWMIPITWSFATWGLDMVGPFKRSKDKKTHLLVAVDKFTKWVEAEPVRKCDAATAVQFLKKINFHTSSSQIMTRSFLKVRWRNFINESTSGLM